MLNSFFFNICLSKKILQPLFFLILSFISFCSFTEKSFQEIRSFYNEVSFQIYEILDLPLGKIKSFFEGMEKNYEYQKTIQSMRGQIFSLEKKLQQLEGHQKSVELIAKQFNFAKEAYHTILVTSVLQRTRYQNKNVILISLRSASQVKINDVVLGPQGVVGRVLQTGLSCAYVLPITHELSHVPVIFENSKIQTVCQGSEGGIQASLTQKMDETAIAILGERVLTSGVGGIYPPSIPVGYVSQVEGDHVTITPLDDDKALTHVAIIKND